MEQQVILVDEQDIAVGSMEKMEAHEKALLHRAFSVFIFNNKNQMLLQRRALHKYHSGGLWTNACCSHPMPGETTDAGANRRLSEELGFTTPLEKMFTFTYRTEFGNGLTENEIDHVYTGNYNGEINLNPAEVSEYCFKSREEIKEAMRNDPAQFTSWFHIAFPMVENWMEKE